MTTVVNKYKDKYDVYIGRGSIFGNPYTHIKDKKTKAQFIVNSRDEAIEKYEEYFYNKIKTDPLFKQEILKLKNKILGCFCKPAPCHGDIIANYLNTVPSDQ